VLNILGTDFFSIDGRVNRYVSFILYFQITSFKTLQVQLIPFSRDINGTCNAVPKNVLSQHLVGGSDTIFTLGNWD